MWTKWRMTKPAGVFLVVLLSATVVSCHPDYAVDLTGGFFYRHEGGDMLDILSGQSSMGGEIPATVLDYAYDEHFIIAVQHPRLPQEPLYSKRYTYPGNREYYYWIIDIIGNQILGPLSDQEFADYRAELGVPESLSVKFPTEQ